MRSQKMVKSTSKMATAVVLPLSRPVASSPRAARRSTCAGVCRPLTAPCHAPVAHVLVAKLRRAARMSLSRPVARPPRAARRSTRAARARPMTAPPVAQRRWTLRRAAQPRPPYPRSFSQTRARQTLARRLRSAASQVKPDPPPTVCQTSPLARVVARRPHHPGLPNSHGIRPFWATAKTWLFAGTTRVHGGVLCRRRAGPLDRGCQLGHVPGKCPPCTPP